MDKVYIYTEKNSVIDINNVIDNSAVNINIIEKQCYWHKSGGLLYLLL